GSEPFPGRSRAEGAVTSSRDDAAPNRIGRPLRNPGRAARPIHLKPMAAARYVAQRIVLAGVLRGVTRVQVFGRTEIETLCGAFVVVANHTSHLDAPLVFTTLPRRLARYLAAGAAADYFFDVPWRRGLTT